jgi:hypothetical protein
MKEIFQIAFFLNCFSSPPTLKIPENSSVVFLFGNSRDLDMKKSKMEKCFGTNGPQKSVSPLWNKNNFKTF